MRAAAPRDPPGPGRPLVPLSRLLAYRRDPLAFVSGMAERWGDVAYFRFGPRHMYLLSHPDLVRDVLVTRHRNFVKSLALQKARVLLGQGLLTSEGEHHLRQRRLAQPAFHRDRIAATAEVMVAYAHRAAGRWREGEPLDAAREMNRLTLAIAGKTLFGAEVEGEADTISRALTDALALFSRLTNPFAFLLDRLPVPATLRMRRARERLDATVFRMIAERRASGRDEDDLLGLLLCARDEEGDGAGMTDEQLRDEVLTLFLAGHETTANALAWTWWLLSRHPEAEARLHAEVDAVLGGRLPTADDLPRLPWTRAVLTESMRLYPPAWTIGREPVEEFEAAGFRVRAGSIVLMSPWVIHRDARFWPEPHTFRPDRWTPEREAALPRMAYFPFGGGPRKCIGEGFAWMEGVMVLATVSSRWRLAAADARHPGTEAGITLRPRGPVLLRPQRRG